MNLKGYYQGLKESNPQLEFRNKVMEKGNISYSMFYNYVSGRWPVPENLQPIFAEVAGMEIKDLFPLTYHEKSKV